MVINLTPHPIALHGADGVVRTLPPSGKVARVRVERVMLDQATPISSETGPIDIAAERPLCIEGLPEPVAGVIYVVSRVVAEAARRVDVLCPDTGAGAVRADGQIIGTYGLVRPFFFGSY